MIKSILVLTALTGFSTAFCGLNAQFTLEEIRMQGEAPQPPQTTPGAIIQAQDNIIPIEEPEKRPCLTKQAGVFNGPSGKETYYNLDMSGVVKIMEDYGYSASDYGIREDGVKMLGEYVIIAANLDVHPRGSIVETSLGPGLVCDTGSFALYNPYQIDIAVNW